MTFGKASALAIALAGALALGIWVSPQVRDIGQIAPSTSVVKGSGVSQDSKAVTSTARTSKSPAKSGAKATDTNAATSDAIPASADNVQAHVKPLLKRGANLDMASDGFRDAEQFVTIAHAARNTEIPFILLKHRVLTEGKSLTRAIRESKPEIDATVEANRARAEAKSDIAKLRG